MKEKSFAMEILQDYKKANKRMFVIVIILIIALIGSIGYTIYLLNDIGYEDTIVTQKNEEGYNNYIGNDGDITNGKTND